MVVSASIKIETKTKKKLDSFKIHQRETYDQLLNRLLNMVNIGVKNDRNK